tara:strand:- start:4 stop:1203 length:1200 start_codon:yes stop_codon:yes gene_type:complete
MKKKKKLKKVLKIKKRILNRGKNKKTKKKLKKNIKTKRKNLGKKKKKIKNFKRRKIQSNKKKKILKKVKKIKLKDKIKKDNLYGILPLKKIKEKLIKAFNIKIFILNLFDPIIGKYNDYLKKKKNEKIKKIEEERKEKEKKLKIEEQLKIQLKEKELKEEIKIAREREKDIKNFLRKEQAEIRREHAGRQRKFFAQLKLEKQIEKFQIREIKELENLEKISLREQRDDYAGLQARIQKLKEKYQAIRDEKIRERVEALGVEIKEGDDREALLQKEKKYRIERHKIENCLESFYRSSASLCFQINKRYITKHQSILRCIDRRFENGEIFIKWDDSSEEDWLLLLYIKNNSPKDGVIIEDKTNPEKNVSHEFKTNEIFRANDLMVDQLVKMLERERTKKAS